MVAAVTGLWIMFFQLGVVIFQFAFLPGVCSVLFLYFSSNPHQKGSLSSGFVMGAFFAAVSFATGAGIPGIPGMDGGDSHLRRILSAAAAREYTGDAWIYYGLAMAGAFMFVLDRLKMNMPPLLLHTLSWAALIFPLLLSGILAQASS